MDRAVHLESASNVRDLGGLPVRGGGMVRRGRVYRGDAIHGATSADVSVLRSLGIRTVYDLRSPDELARDGIGQFAGSIAEHRHAPIVQVSLSPFDPRIDWATVNLRDRYLEMLEQGGDAIRSVMLALCDDRSGPVLFHCSGGKDRTGVVAALILRVLGVADEDIIADYAMSERNLAPRVRAFLDRLEGAGIDDDAIAYLTSSPPARMRYTLREIDARWGSAPRYLETIGVGAEEIARVEANLVERARP